MDAKSGYAQNEKAPVPLEVHYEVFKDIEKQIHQTLERTASKDLMIGLRVAYDELDSKHEPGVMPFKVESGYLSLIDYTIDCLPFEEESPERPADEAWDFPLPLSVMKELYNETRERLEEAAGVELNVGVFYVFMGSPSKGGATRCACKRQKGQTQIFTVDPTTGKQTNDCFKGCKKIK